jgi:hypothetical protein
MNLINQFIDRINAWAINRFLPHRFDIEVSALAIQYQFNSQTSQFAWNEITRIYGACVSQYIGNLLVLVIYFENEKIYVTEHSKTAWNELITQIPLRLENAEKYENWSLQLISRPDNSEPILIYEKSMDEPK